jgi:hypothetical protein
MWLLSKGGRHLLLLVYSRREYSHTVNALLIFDTMWQRVLGILGVGSGADVGTRPST